MEFIENIGIEVIPAIAVICFLIGEAVKLTPLDEKWIPVICGFCGGCLGVVAMYTMPEFPATSVLSSIAVGIVSGLAATGAHQIWKQVPQKGAHEE